MSHNIEINNGIASFAENGRKERAWHELGQVFDGPMTVKEALEASHADYEVTLNNVAVITPEIAEAMANGDVPSDLILKALVKGKKATFRTDKNKPLGIVGENYGIVQNLDAFTFIDTLCTGQVGGSVPVIECAGVLGHGERVFITAKFPDKIILDNKGDDIVDMYVVFTTSHDGTGAVKCMVTPTRVVCNNTLNLALSNNRGCISLRHSSNVMQRLDLTSKENTEFAFRTLNLMSVYKKSLEAQFDHLRNIKVSERDLDNILAQVALSEKDAKIFLETRRIDHEDIATRGRRQFEAMKLAVEQGVGQEFCESGTGMWLVNGITTYYQNYADFRNDEVKFDSILHGYSGKKVMDACLALDRL